LQVQKSVPFVSARFIVLAFALLAALLLASAAGYLIRGGSVATTSAVGAAPAIVHFQQMSDNQMERAQVRAQVSPKLTSPYGVGH
jgi:hypothetical protein